MVVRICRLSLALAPLFFLAVLSLPAAEDESDRKMEQQLQAQVNTLLSEARRAVSTGDRALAERKISEALALDPANREAQRLQSALPRAVRAERGVVSRRERDARIQELLSEGLRAHRRGDVATAAARWREVLLIEPNHPRATVYLREVEPQLSEFQAQQAKLEASKRAEAEAAGRLEEKVTIEVREGTTLREFLNTLSFVTGINFVIARGADVPVVAKFEDTALRTVLETVLAPSGLTWTREGDVITVVPNLRTRVFHLSSDMLLNVRRLYETGELQRLLWGAPQPPLPGASLNLDERQAMLLLTDAPANIAKLEGLVATLRAEPAAQRLDTRIYEVRGDLADEVRILVEAMLKTGPEPPYAVERRVILAETEKGANLIVKDSEENLRRIEALMTDRQFLRQLEEEEIDIMTVNLTPRQVLQTNQEQVQAFAQDVVEVVSTMLYHEAGMAQAATMGRRLWFDPATLQLTVTDYPSNIRKVSEFITSLPQFEPKRRSKILYLEFATASDMVSNLEAILGISGAAAGGAAGGAEATFSLRVEDERTFRDLSIRLVRVDENVFGDDNDDSCQLVVRTSTAQSSDLSVPEFRSEVFEDYEIYVEEVDPSPTPGEGRARIRVSFRPGLGPGGYGGGYAPGGGYGGGGGGYGGSGYSAPGGFGGFVY